MAGVVKGSVGGQTGFGTDKNNQQNQILFVHLRRIEDVFLKEGEERGRSGANGVERGFNVKGGEWVWDGVCGD